MTSRPLFCSTSERSPSVSSTEKPPELAEPLSGVEANSGGFAVDETDGGRSEVKQNNGLDVIR